MHSLTLQKYDYEEEVTRHVPLVVHLCIPYLYAVYFMTLAIKWNSEFRNRLMCKSIETSTPKEREIRRGEDSDSERTRRSEVPTAEVVGHVE